MMKVGIAGAGEIAVYHIAFAKEIKGVEVISICDTNRERAKELASRFGINTSYDSLSKMLKDSKIDVVHILTPPKTHAELAIEAMNAGRHVLVEKPMAVSVYEGERMVEAAMKNNVQLTICHMYLFDPIIQKLFEMDLAGSFGNVIYTEGYWFTDIAQGVSDAYKVGGLKSGWAYDLPGGVFANFIDHPIYLQQKFLGKINDVHVSINRMGDNPFIAYDEVRIYLEGERANGIIALSLNIKPRLNTFRVYGTQMVASADMSNMTLTTQPVLKLPRMFYKAFLNFNQANQLITDTFSNSFKILTGKMRARQGLRSFIKQFYDSLHSKNPVPVTSEEGLESVKLLAKIWEQAEKKNRTKKWVFTEGARPAYLEGYEYNNIKSGHFDKEQKERKTILITGANGFIGRNFIDRLLKLDFNIRVLIRRINKPYFENNRIDVIYADIRDSVALRYAVKDVDIVYHMAGIVSNKGKWSDFIESNVESTRNLLECSMKENIDKFIYLSSVLVYGFKKINGRNRIMEEDAYGKDIGKYHYYAKSKIEAEKIVFDYFRNHNLPIVVIRPGIIYGPHGDNIFRKKRLVFAKPGSLMPYTFVENLIDALILAAENQDAIGNAFTIVDDNSISCRQFLKKAHQVANGKFGAIFVPMSILALAARLFEFKANRKNSENTPPISMASIDVLRRNLIYDNQKAKEVLGWKPQVPLNTALERTYRWFETMD